MSRLSLWSAGAACTLCTRTRDGLIHPARKFLNVISSCVDSNELELLSRPCHWSFGLQNHFVPCGRLVARAMDALRQQPHRVGSRVRARTIVRTGAAATILEGLWFAHFRFACLQLVGRFATHDVQSLRQQTTGSSVVEIMYCIVELWRFHVSV